MSALVRRALMQAAKRRAQGVPWENVKLLMHMDDTGLTDVKGHASGDSIGTVTRSSTQSKFGGYSAYFNGSSARQAVTTNADFDFGSGDFTVEAWVYITSMVTGYFPVISKWVGPSGNYHWLLAYAQTGGLNFSAIAEGPGDTYLVALSQAVNNPALNTWIHVAATRQGNTFRIFQNGVIVGSATGTGIIKPSNGNIYIGGYLASSLHGNGYIDEARIVKGIALYTEAFTPLTAPFPDF